MLKDTDEKIKFRVLVRRLAKFGETRRSAIGLLELLWKHAAIDAPQGDVGRFTDEEIAAVLEFDGPPEELVDSLVVSGWLDRCERHRLVVHDWHEHAPRWVASKLAREGKEFAKASAVPSAVPTAVASAVPSALAGNESSVPSAVPTHSLAIHSHSIHRKKEASASSAEFAADAATPLTSPSDGSPVVMEFPCSGNPKTWALRQDRVDRWQEAFPAVDVRAELLKARAWLEDRPRNHKTAAGMAKFLGGWMGRAQDRSGTLSGRGDPNAGLTIQERVRRKLASIPITDGSDRE